MSTEIEETLKRVQSHKGVKGQSDRYRLPSLSLGVLIMNSEGITIKSNLPPEETEMYAALLSQLAIKVLLLRLRCLR